MSTINIKKTMSGATAIGATLQDVPRVMHPRVSRAFATTTPKDAEVYRSYTIADNLLFSTPQSTPFDTTPTSPEVVELVERVIANTIASDPLMQLELGTAQTAISPAPAAQNMPFIEAQLEQNPFVGQYVGPVLLNCYIRPMTQMADPYVEGGCMRAAPYVEKAIATARPYVEGGVQRAAPYYDGAVAKARQAKEVPGQVVQSVKAAPSQAYHTTIDQVTSIMQRVKAAPGQVYQTTTTMATAVAAHIKATPAKISESTKDVPAQASETITAAPSKVYETTVNSATSISQRMKALAGHVYKTATNVATSMVRTVKAAPGKFQQSIVNITTLLANSRANASQTYVRRAIGFMSPYLESVKGNERVQAAYHHRVVQGGIERATPYVSRVVEHPRISKIAEVVMEWALPKTKEAKTE